MEREDTEVNRPDDRGEELPESPAPDPEEKEHPRPEDDRNDELDESPAPDPEQTDSDAEDVPGAD